MKATAQNQIIVSTGTPQWQNIAMTVSNASIRVITICNSNGTVTTIDGWNSNEILQTNDGESYQTISEDSALVEDVFYGSRNTQDAINVVECAYADVGKLEREGDSTVNAAYDSSCKYR